MRQWTQEERGILKKHYGEIPIEEMMKKLPSRSKKAIYNQVNYLRKRGWTFG